MPWLWGTLLLGLEITASVKHSLLSSSTASAAQQLRDRGFVKLSARIDESLVQDAARSCMVHLESLLDDVAQSGCDVIEQQYSFSTICHRQRLRWDLKGLHDLPSWQMLCANAVQIVEAELATVARVKVLMSGFVVSRPGAEEQRFHADGNEDGLFTCFIPLVDIDEDADGTQFWPGSHVDAHAPTLAPSLEYDDTRMEHMVAPRCPSGGVLLFDYRIIHRGLANAGRDRPVAYLVLTAADSGVSDTINFPRLSIADTRPSDVAGFPRWDE